LAIARFSLFLRQFQATVTQQEVSSPPFFNSETLGMSLVVFGIAVIPLALWRYNRVFWQIERGDYRPNRVLVWIMSATVMILGTLTIPLLLWRDRGNIAPTSTPKNSQF